MFTWIRRMSFGSHPKTESDMATAVDSKGTRLEVGDTVVVPLPPISHARIVGIRHDKAILLRYEPEGPLITLSAAMMSRSKWVKQPAAEKVKP